MPLNLLKRSEKGSALNATEHDANLTAIEDEVNAKASSSHTHSIANVTGLQTALDAKETPTGAQAKADAAQLAAASDATTKASAAQAAATAAASADATTKASAAQSAAISAAATDATTKANAAQAAAIAAAATDATTKANAAAAASIPLSQKGANDGVATLDSTGKVPSVQLPSYVDDVIEGANLAAFPATGEAGKIYVALDTGKTYRWSGSAYVEISPSPGSTDSVTEGSTNLYHTAARVRATTLTGIDTSTAGTVSATDSILSALGKIWQRLVNLAAVATSGDYGDLSGLPTLGSAAAADTGDFATAAQGAKADSAAQIAGDLAGTAAAPVVAKINGVAVTGTPTAGQVPTATSGTAATWQTPSGGGSPGGSNTQVQFNDGGTFAGAANWTWNKTTNTVTLTGTHAIVAGAADNHTFATSGNRLVIRGGGTSSTFGLAVGTRSFAFHFGDSNSGTSTQVFFSPTEVNSAVSNTSGTSSSASIQSAGFKLPSTGALLWGTLTHAGSASTPDTGLSRNAAGVVEVNSGTAGTLRDLRLRNLTSVGGVIAPSQYTTATRPAWANGAVIFDTDLDKLVIGGASAWEVVTSA